MLCYHLLSKLKQACNLSTIIPKDMAPKDHLVWIDLEVRNINTLFDVGFMTKRCYFR
jgi:hypothetical protein